MRRNKKTFSMESEISTKLKNKNIPILILDEKWLEIFPEHMQTSSVRVIASDLVDLLKQQGKSVDELKGMKRYKSQLMHEIVENMDADDSVIGKLKRKKMDKNQKKILELKEEMERRQDELAELPYQIRQANLDLLIESTRLCYERFHENQEKLEELDGEILELREKLKLKLLDQQDRKMKNEKIYTYLHSVLGPDLMERFDAELGEL